MTEQLKVGVIMGSDSDLDTMRHVGRALTTLGLESGNGYEERVVSAHRTPDKMMQYAHEAEERELRVIIAGAGGSAHLPGMVASETLLPVLGVAVTSSPDTLNRALGSLIGMPEGKPLATFQGKAGAFNAGLFAVRLLISGNEENTELRQAYLDYEAGLKDAVEFRDDELSRMGAEDYIANQKRIQAQI